jgi:hypothetical protein
MEGVKVPTEGGMVEIHYGFVAALEIALEAWENLLDELDEENGEIQVFSERFVSGGPDDEGGTVDGMIVQDTTAIFVDFKFGQHEVDAEGWQNFWYMICARREMPSLFARVQEWHSVIIQPAYEPPIARVVIPSSVLDRMEQEAMTAIAASKTPSPHYIEGEWCRWCDAKLACPAKTRRLVTLTMPNHVLDLGDLEKMVARLREWDKWRDEAEARILHEMEHGRQFSLFKLVNKRAVRGWQSEAGTIAALKAKRIPAKDYMKPAELHSPAQMEQRGLLTKKETEPLTISVSSGVTIAPMASKAPAVLPTKALAQALKV